MYRVYTEVFFRVYVQLIVYMETSTSIGIVYYEIVYGMLIIIYNNILYVCM